MNRRTVLTQLTASAAMVALARPSFATDGDFEITRTDAEWRDRLTDAEYEVLRAEGTERPFSSPLDTLYEPGTYHCKGCDLAVYPSDTKYDSGTGWPSFWESLADAVRTKEDRRFIFQVRTEVHCRRCGSHLGHIFDDGPDPTGKRHCLNGIALVFKPA